MRRYTHLVDMAEWHSMHEVPSERVNLFKKE